MSATRDLRMVSIAVLTLALAAPAFVAAGMSRHAHGIVLRSAFLPPRRIPTFFNPRYALLTPRHVPTGRGPAPQKQLWATHHQHLRYVGPPHCPAGTSWQYGCVSWGKPWPGRGALFGRCLAMGWSCKRAPTPIY
jgi:hypothetical protein